MNGVFSVEELRGILLDVDEEAFLELGRSRRFDVIVVGGGALLLSGLSLRTSTRDIDLLGCDDAIKGIIARHLEINMQVRVYADRLPDGFEDRLVRLPLETRVVDYYRPSNEDLAVMKLYSWRKQDQEDLLNSRMLSELDQGVLEKLVYDDGGAKASCNARLVYDRMVETYDKKFLPRAVKAAKRRGISGWVAAR